MSFASAAAFADRKLILSLSDHCRDRMDFNADHFALFELPATFRLDAALLDRRYLELQSQVHPDRFANASVAERRLSLQWSTRVNEAYQTLKKPLPRAKYLFHLAAQDISSEAVSAEFLMEQMAWRESVAEARAAGEYHELEHLHHRLQRDMSERYDQLTDVFDNQRDLAQAADHVRRLMFLDKLFAEIEEAMAECEE